MKWFELCDGGVGSKKPTATAAKAPNATKAFNTTELLLFGTSQPNDGDMGSFPARSKATVVHARTKSL
jgi:hypothetical protein